MCMICCLMTACLSFFFFKQKTAYEMRISDWSSDVCSSDLSPHPYRSSAPPTTTSGGRRRTRRGPYRLLYMRHGQYSVICSHCGSATTRAGPDDREQADDPGTTDGCCDLPAQRDEELRIPHGPRGHLLRHPPGQGERGDGPVRHRQVGAAQERHRPAAARQR